MRHRRDTSVWSRADGLNVDGVGSGTDALWLALLADSELVENNLRFVGEVDLEPGSRSRKGQLAFFFDLTPEHRSAPLRDMNGFSFVSTEYASDLNLRTVMLVPVVDASGRQLKLRVRVEPVGK